MAKHPGRHGVDLGLDPLPHLHRPGRHRHAAVGVDVHERPALVEDRVGEGDAEADRHQGQTLLLKAVGSG